MALLISQVLTDKALVAGFAGAAGALALFFLLYLLGTRKIHPNEPTVVPPLVPFVGHLLGMAMYGGKYVKKLGLSHKHVAIFTLPVPKSRIYIVTDPSLAAAVQRASKALSFTPLVPDITERVLGLDKRTVDIVRQNLDPEKGGDRGFLADIHDMLYSYLGPGEALNEMSVDASQELYHQLRVYLKTIQDKECQSDEVDLLFWVRHFVAIGTAKFLYGPNNPFEVQPELEKSFWDFDHGLGGLLMGIMPSLTAAKAYNGRERLAKAIQKYLEAGHHKTGSRIVQNRVRIAEQYNWAVDMTARSELSFLFAGIVNTATTIFWIILQVFSRPELLEMIRAEINDAVSASQEKFGENHLSIAAVKESCTTLDAVLRECLRVGSENFSTRLVKADTLLADKYFLRKDSVIQIAGSVIHADSDIWGADAGSFNHGRFLKQQESKESKTHPAAFRAFGGGKTLCPGRHFATNEILMFAVAMITSFDFEAPGGGRIVVPKKNDAIMPVHILEPLTKDPVRVLAKLRGEANDVAKWIVEL